MAAYRNYCERCGEEDGGDSIRCDRCGIQMCGGCATADEIATEECASCRGKAAKQERLDELRMARANVMPCMRTWYDKHVLQAAARGE